MNYKVETNDTIQNESIYTNNKNLIKKGLFVLLLGIVIYIGFVSDILTGFLEWVEENPALSAIIFAFSLQFF